MTQPLATAPTQRKNTRLGLAKWLREQGIDCPSIVLGSTFLLNGQTLKVVDASSTNTWGGNNALMKLVEAA
jgi:hypothetical protein